MPRSLLFVCHTLSRNRCHPVYIDDLPNGSNGMIAATIAYTPISGSDGKTSVLRDLTHHNDVQNRADVNRCAGCRIRSCRHSSRDKAHNSITCYRDSVACSSVCGGKDFWSIGIEGSVVDVNSEVDGAGKSKVCGVSSDSGIGEEECTGDEGANDHGVSGKHCVSEG